MQWTYIHKFKNNAGVMESDSVYMQIIIQHNVHRRQSR